MSDSSYKIILKEFLNFEANIPKIIYYISSQNILVCFDILGFAKMIVIKQL